MNPMPERTPPERVHPSGRLTFRSKVRAPRRDDLPLVEPNDASIEWERLVPSDWEGPIELEIGCGKGQFIAAAAESRPETFFLGCEAGPDYARYCADRLARQGSQNAKMVADDARLLLADSIPERRLRRIHVYHPDPWPKRRHRKRRIFDAEFAALCARTLTRDGQLLVATDNTRYFGEILTVLGASQDLRRAPSLESEYGDEVPGLAFGPTNFAKKYVAEERERHRAVYVIAAAPTEIAVETESSWVRVARFDEIPVGEGLPITVGERELALFLDGRELRCLRDSCPHRGAALSEGHVQDGEVVCPWHGWRYSLSDGECSTLPGSAAAETFEVERRGDEVWIRI